MVTTKRFFLIILCLTVFTSLGYIFLFGVWRRRSDERIVYIESPAGGLGDRLRAVILAYYIALLTNRSLKLNGNELWGNEDDYFETNVVNWKISKEEERVIHSWFSSKESFVERDALQVRYDEINFDILSEVEVISLSTNWFELDLLAKNPTLRSSPKFELFNELYQSGRLSQHALNNVFKPGKRVVPYLDEIQRQYWPSKDILRIGMHLRNGDNERLISNSNSNSNSSKRKRGREVNVQRAECFASKAISIWEEKKRLGNYKNVIFFISSDLVDSEEIVIKVIESQGYQIFRNNNLGEAKHIDKTSDDQIRTFVDWWTLVNMDIMLLPISGFSEFASKFSCIPSYLFFETWESCEKLFTPFIDNGFCHKEFDQTFLLNTRVAKTQ